MHPRRESRVFYWRNLFFGFFRLRMRFAPLGVMLKRAFSGIGEPRIALPSLKRNFFNCVVNTFVAIAENWFVIANLVIARPDRTIARFGNKMSPGRTGTFEGHAHELCFFEPRGGSVNTRDDFRGRI